jgi:hypothetical protein
MGSSFLSALYDMYAVTLKELKAILNLSAQAGKSGAVKILSGITAQDNFQEENRCKRHISNNT